MRSHSQRWVIFLGVLLSVLLANASLAAAQSSEGIQVKPAVVEDNVNLGEVYQFTVNVTNVADIPQTFTISTKDINGLDDNGQPIFAPPGQATTSYSLSSWIVVPPAPITLQAGESREITFTVNVPLQTSPGAHFGGVFFTSSTGQTNGNGSAVSVQVGTVISLQIAGEAVESARIREFSTDKLVYSSPDVVFTTKMENLGNVLETPHGVIEITNMFGKEVQVITVNDTAAPVFPGSVRAYTTDWQDSGFAIGRYQAVVSLSYGSDSKQTISSITSFWVVPLKLIGSVIGSLLLLVLILYLWVRMYLRKQLRAMGVKPKDSEINYYAKRYNRTGSRLVVVVFGLVLLCVVLVAVLFVMFA